MLPDRGPLLLGWHGGLGVISTIFDSGPASYLWRLWNAGIMSIRSVILSSTIKQKMMDAFNDYVRNAIRVSTVAPVQLHGNNIGMVRKFKTDTSSCFRMLATSWVWTWERSGYAESRSKTGEGGEERSGRDAEMDEAARDL
ncbi:hypothetical protein FB446DRAFT_709421 [Lentinula raphanica]|nr:hypothetical protein FB446DRAFT_709421 [Lentinula raphanica]